MQNARLLCLVLFSVVIVGETARGEVLSAVAERARVTLETLERQDDIRTPAEAPSWLIMHTLLAFGQDYLLRSEQEEDVRIPLSERLWDNIEDPKAKGYTPVFCCEGDIIVADRGSSTAWGERHPFQFLWCLSEAGLPPSMSIHVEGRPSTKISQICTDAEKRITEFSTLSWVLPTVAQYRGCGYKWVNRFDEKLTINQLLKVLLSPDHHADDYCAESHKAFAVAKILSLCREQSGSDNVEIQAACQWLDARWSKYQENTHSNGQIDYQAVGWPAWPEESFRAAAEAGAAGHMLAWMALDWQRAGMPSLIDAVAVDAIESLDATIIPSGLNGIFARGNLCHAVHGLRLYLKSRGIHTVATR
jgi:hypothetical protein